MGEYWYLSFPSNCFFSSPLSSATSPFYSFTYLSHPFFKPCGDLCSLDDLSQIFLGTLCVCVCVQIQSYTLIYLAQGLVDLFQIEISSLTSIDTLSIGSFQFSLSSRTLFFQPEPSYKKHIHLNNSVQSRIFLTILLHLTYVFFRFTFCLQRDHSMIQLSYKRVLLLLFALRLTFNSMDYSPPGSFCLCKNIKWLAIYFSRGFSQLRMEPVIPALYHSLLNNKYMFIFNCQTLSYFLSFCHS